MPDDEIYIVTSHTDYDHDVYNEVNGALYQVLRETRRWSCTCPHFIFRLRKAGGECKHITLVKETIK
jgi:hypothetical protein